MNQTDKDNDMQQRPGFLLPVPEEILRMATELRSIEVALGNLPPEDWALPKLHAKVNDANFSHFANKAESRTEEIFRTICGSMTERGYKIREIVGFINNQLSYPDGISYCSEQEVREVLGIDE